MPQSLLIFNIIFLPVYPVTIYLKNEHNLAVNANKVNVLYHPVHKIDRDLCLQGLKRELSHPAIRSGRIFL